MVHEIQEEKRFQRESGQLYECSGGQHENTIGLATVTDHLDWRRFSIVQELETQLEQVKMRMEGEEIETANKDNCE